jgi:formiminotetrahydrofolate cyclodeaminase
MKKTAQNDITGAWLVSKPNTEQFEKNFDLIFGKKEKVLKELDKTIQDNQELLEAISDIEYELNKSTGEVQKVENGNTTNTSK